MTDLPKEALADISYQDPFANHYSMRTDSNPEKYLQDLKALPKDQRLNRLFVIVLLRQIAMARARFVLQSEQTAVITRACEIMGQTSRINSPEANHICLWLHRRYLSAGLADSPYYNDQIANMVIQLSVMPELDDIIGPPLHHLEVQDIRLDPENIRALIEDEQTT